MRFERLYPHQIEFIGGFMPVTVMLGAGVGKTTALARAIAERCTGLVLGALHLESHAVLALARDYDGLLRLFHLVLSQLETVGIAVDRLSVVHEKRYLSIALSHPVGSCKIFFRLLSNWNKWLGGAYSLWFADDVGVEDLKAIRTAISRTREQPRLGFATSSDLTAVEVCELFDGLGLHLVLPREASA